MKFNKSLQFKSWLFLIVFSFHSTSQAQVNINFQPKILECQVKENDSPTQLFRITTIPLGKVALGKTANVRSYITQKSENFFSVEGFLTQYEARFYSEADLKTEDDKLNASFWSRDLLVEITCRLGTK